MKATTKLLLEHFVESKDVQELRKQMIQISCAFDFLLDDEDEKMKAIHDCIYLLDIVIEEKEGDVYEEE